MATSVRAVPTFEVLIPTRDQVGERQFVCTVGHIPKVGRPEELVKMVPEESGEG